MKRFYLVAFLLLGGILAWLFLVPVKAPSTGEKTWKKDSANRAEELIASIDYVTGFSPVAVSEDVIQRPIFFKERKPPEDYVPATGEKKPAATPRGKQSPPRLFLSAIVRIGDETFALVTLPGSKGTRRVKVGEEFDDWKVKAILADRVVLRSGKTKHEIPLREYKPVPPSREKPRKTKKARSQSPTVKRGRPPKQGRVQTKAKVVTE